MDLGTLVVPFAPSVPLHVNPSNFKVSECLFFTDIMKQGSKFDVNLLYS